MRNLNAVPARRGLTVIKGTIGYPPQQALRSILNPAGTPLSKSDIVNAVEATPDDLPKSVIVTLNSGRTSDNPFAKPTAPQRFMADSNANAVAAMKEYGIRKIVVMQALGVGTSFPNLLFAMRWVVRHSNMAVSFEDHEFVDQEIRQTGVDYVLVRPARLTEGEAKPVKMYGDNGDLIGGFAAITKKSVAVFLVDAAEKSEWDHKTPVISN